MGAENQYADVIAQVGGRFVSASSVMSNLNADPHSFEASPDIARRVAGASLVVQNGQGYDDFMAKIEAANPDIGRRVVVVSTLLGVARSDPNPHFWYDPVTMPAVAAEVARDLSRIEPDHAAYFATRRDGFDRSLQAIDTALAQLRSDDAGAPVASTEPVADDLLKAAALDNRSPWGFEIDVMNGVDPAPQDIATMRALLDNHEVRVLVYNRQVTDTLTASLLSLARARGISVVGVYETMPEPGYHYQNWMLAELRALDGAISRGISSPQL